MPALALTRASCHCRADRRGFAIVVSVRGGEEKVPRSLPIEWKGGINGSSERPASSNQRNSKEIRFDIMSGSVVNHNKQWIGTRSHAENHFVVVVVILDENAVDSARFVLTHKPRDLPSTARGSCSDRRTARSS